MTQTLEQQLDALIAEHGLNKVLRSLQGRIECLRNDGDDALVISIGTRARDFGGDENDAGAAEATVSIGSITATAGAKYLDDAIRLARRKILNEREARAKKAEKARADKDIAIVAHLGGAL